MRPFIFPLFFIPKFTHGKDTPVLESRSVNLPNALTLIRIFAVPLLVALLLTKDHMLVASFIFLAASLTDLLDGYLARKRGQVTTLGVLLDPLADKLLISSAFIALIPHGIVPAWMVVLIVGREFAVSGLRSIASSQGFTISASDLGKIKMVAQVAAITLLTLGHEFPIFNDIAQLALYVVVLFALVSALDYFRTFWTQIDDRFKAQERQRTILAEKRTRPDVPAP
jgi:CDP-diacylglycerol--glycerol-3-phosphate 3-phosphatidyltransferase